MNKLIVPVLLAAVLGSGTVALAQERHQPGERGGWQQHERAGQDRQRGATKGHLRSDARPGNKKHLYRMVDADGDLRRGEQLPRRYRTHHYVVENWRAHRLSAPPRGHQWVQAGNSYALVSIATGRVTQVLLGQ